MILLKGKKYRFLARPRPSLPHHAKSGRAGGPRVPGLRTARNDNARVASGAAESRAPSKLERESEFFSGLLGALSRQRPEQRCTRGESGDCQSGSFHGALN